MNDVDAAIAALRRGAVAVIPTDTVYGLVANADDERAARALYAAKGRDARRPTAVLFASVDELLRRVPELPSRAVAVARALLPGHLGAHRARPVGPAGAHGPTILARWLA